MMLKTSSRSLNPFFGMFKTTLHKNIGLIILLSVAVLLVCGGNYFTAGANHILFEGMESDYFFVLSKGLVYILAVVGIGSVLLYNFLNFMFLYSKRSSDVFHALPLTRTELLCSRCLSGLIFSIIPVTLGFVFISVLNCFEKFPVSFDFLAGSYLYILIAMLVCSAFSMLFVVCAGSAFDMVLSFAGVNLGLLFAGYITVIIIEECLIGFRGEDGVLTVMKSLSPFVYAAYALRDIVNLNYRFGEVLEYFIRSGIMIAAFGGLSVYLFKRRKSERGGQAYAFSFLYIICAILISFCAAFLLGAIFSGGEFNIIFWIFAPVGAILAAIVYTAVTNRGFKNLKGGIASAISSIAAMAIVFAAAKAGGFGFINRMPKQSEVNEVVVRLHGEEITFIDSEVPFKMHKEILDKKAYEYDLENNADIYSTYFYIDYNLKNGKTISRGYNIYTKPGQNVFKMFAKADRRYVGALQALKIGGYQTLNVDYYISDNDEYEQSYITADEFEKLISIYREEVKNVSFIGDMGEHYEEYYTFSNYEQKSDKFFNMDLFISDDFTESKAYLESLELENRVAKEEVLYD